METKVITQLDLADAQFIGFNQGKVDGNIVTLIRSMSLTKQEWEEWKNNYTNILCESDYEYIEEYFNSNNHENKLT